MVHCGVCGGPCSLRGQDRFACSAHITNRSCGNGHTIARQGLEERVLTGLGDRIMAPDAAEAALRAYAEETNQLNRERRARWNVPARSWRRSIGQSKKSWISWRAAGIRAF
ncbi:hypothetical protein [Chelativorans sp.]|uniref:hypothetical protein n=1 Tax=Chelativorans sp. TaxID=2203393 RepID=UPI0035C723F0